MKWLRTFCYYVVAFAGGALAWGAAYYLYKRFGSTMDTGISTAEDPYYAIIAVVPILQNALPDHLTLFDIAVDPPALWEEQRRRVWHH